MSEVSQHLRRQGEAATRLPEGATTREEACEQIRQFWKDVWAPSELSEAQAQSDPQKTLLDPMLQHLRGKTLPAWEDEEEWEEGLSRGVAKARGVCGGDGRHGDEIAVLPPGTVRNFYEVSRSWRRNGVAPQNMRIIVQAMMPKPGKTPTIANLRPLSLQSAWRAFESGMLQTSFFKDWRTEVGTKQVAYREAAEHCAAIAATNFEEQKFLAALDFSKAFDKMDPAKTRQLLQCSRIPNPVSDLLFEAWHRQTRYIRFDGHVSPEVLEVTNAHPQGGPWGPRVCQLWLIAGVVRG